MQTIWDLLPASLWPTQPFIPPDQQARVMQALWAQQPSANSLAAAPANRAGIAQALAPAPLASGGGAANTAGGILGPLAMGGGDVNTAGGILGPVLGQAANFPPATDPPILPPPMPDTYASGPGRNAQLTAPPAPRPPGGTDMAGNGAGPTAAPGLARAVGDLPAHTRQGAYWLAQHGVDTALPPPADWAAAPSQPQTSSTTSDILWALPRGLMLGSGDFINSAAAADDPDILWGKYLAGQDLPDIADQQQRQLAEVQRATADAQRRVRQSVGMPAEASTRAGRLVEGGARFLGNPITWLGGPEGFGAKALTGFLSGVGSEAGGELAAGTKWETPMRLVGSIAGPMIPVAGARAFNSLYDALPSGVGALGGKLVQPAERAPSAAPAALGQARDLTFEEENRLILYDRNRRTLEEIDPSNPKLATDHPPDWIPSVQDIKLINNEIADLRTKLGFLDLENHHGFLQGRTFRPIYNNAGINVHDYKAYIWNRDHRALDQGSNNWTKQWRIFHKSFPQANSDMLHEQLNKMLKQMP